MRWLSAAVAVVTMAAVAWLGVAPTSASVSNWVGSLECRAVLAPVEGISLVQNLTPQQDEIAEEWLIAVGYIDEGESPTAEQMSAVSASVQTACGAAQQQRATWMVLIAVFGSALALAARSRRPFVASPERIPTDG